MGDCILLHCMVVYIGKEIVAKFNVNENIDFVRLALCVWGGGRRHTYTSG